VFSRVSQGYDWIERVTCEESAVPPGGICGPPPTRIPTQPPTRNVSYLSVLFGGDGEKHSHLRPPCKLEIRVLGYRNYFVPLSGFVDSLLPSHSNSYDHTLTNIPLVFLIQPTNLPTRFPTRNVSFNFTTLILIYF